MFSFGSKTGAPSASGCGCPCEGHRGRLRREARRTRSYFVLMEVTRVGSLWWGSNYGSQQLEGYLPPYGKRGAPLSLDARVQRKATPRWITHDILCKKLKTLDEVKCSSARTRVPTLIPTLICMFTMPKLHPVENYLLLY